MNNLIKQIQDTDPLTEAEKITGKSYKEDQETVLKGIQLQFQKSDLMNALMDSSDDTKFSETVKEYLRKVIDFGFEVVLKQDSPSDDNIIESLYIMWHKKYSILLCFDTFHGKRNGGKFYYNWSPNSSRFSCTSSGGFKGTYWLPDFSGELINPEPSPLWRDMSWNEYQVIEKAWSKRDDQWIKDNNLRSIWVGDHDCREALKNNINQLVNEGQFLQQWKQKPFLWLLCHTEKNTDDYQEINQKRIEQLPDYVKQCIGS